MTAPTRSSRFLPCAGFTLLEALLALAILAVLATVIASGLAGFRDAAALDQAVDGALALLREARARTLASESAASHGVHFAPSSLTLFRGGSFAPTDPANVVLTLPGTVAVSGLTLTTSTASVVFERLTGESPVTGTVPFRSTRSGNTKVIEIFSSGAFRKQ